ncbi:hypothetical protein FHG87_024998, partial [Trinorchestia longiramus]
MSQLRCCSPSSKPLCQCPCTDTGAPLIRSTSGGSPQCCSARPLSPTHQQLLQHQVRIASSTPPPRLQRQYSGTSTPPKPGSNINSPVTSYSPLGSSGLSQISLSSATLPRQRSYDPPPSQSSHQPPSATLHRQRSVTDNQSHPISYSS